MHWRTTVLSTSKIVQPPAQRIRSPGDLTARERERAARSQGFAISQPLVHRELRGFFQDRSGVLLGQALLRILGKLTLSKISVSCHWVEGQK